MLQWNVRGGDLVMFIDNGLNSIMMNQMKPPPYPLIASIISNLLPLTAPLNIHTLQTLIRSKHCFTKEMWTKSNPDTKIWSMRIELEDGMGLSFYPARSAQGGATTSKMRSGIFIALNRIHESDQQSTLPWTGPMNRLRRLEDHFLC